MNLNSIINDFTANLNNLQQTISDAKKTLGIEAETDNKAKEMFNIVKEFESGKISQKECLEKITNESRIS